MLFRSILYLGDILISFGDFLENNAQLIPSGYVEEYWLAEVEQKIQQYDAKTELEEFLTKTPSLEEAIEISINFKIPLHPKYLFYWEQLSSHELEQLLSPIKVEEEKIIYDKKIKPILEKLGAPHDVSADNVILKEIEAEIFYQLLLSNPIKIVETDSVPQIISSGTGIRIKPKFSASIGVRIGRPEKAAARLMKPPVHTLFPIGNKGGMTRDLVKASMGSEFYCNIFNRTCKNCNIP